MVTYFLDTNILWWYYVSNSKYHTTVKKFLDPIIMESDSNFIVNEFVMIELMHMLIKRRGKNGYKMINQILEELTIIELKFDIVSKEHLLGILDKLNSFGHTTSIGGRDASILFSIDKYKGTELISNDNAFTKINGLVTHNPISDN